MMKKSSIFSLLKPYKTLVSILVIVAVATSAMGLVFPKIISHSIDAYLRHDFVLSTLLWQFGGVAIFIFILTYVQNTVQIYTSERAAKDLRNQLATTLSQQSYAFVEKIGQAKLLTHLTSDIDSIKLFIAQAIASLLSSVIIIIGASILLISINWKLALVVLTIVPVIGGLFFVVLRRVRVLMKQSREVIDWLNKVINESILGAALIRVLHSQRSEADKFLAANAQAKNLGLRVLKNFATMIPVITLVANMATLAILTLGGHFVIIDTMSLGDFAAFNSYVAVLIFPIIMIGFMSNVIAQATASYDRIIEILVAKPLPDTGTLDRRLRGEIQLDHITLQYDHKPVLKDLSLTVAEHSRLAIIGPTAAGKTQLLYLLIGLIEPTSGSIAYDGHNLHSYSRAALHEQIGLVFQDSIIFNLTLRENIAFSDTVRDADLDKAIQTAELTDFVAALPKGLDTVVSERGANLSGGQRQRIMLARALALNPTLLLLDDFTARVDTITERKILENINHNYPEITIVSVTQKIGAIEQYDRIALLMEGELIAYDTHQQLLKTCPEYIQIYDSQRSTHHYE